MSAPRFAKRAVAFIVASGMVIAGGALAIAPASAVPTDFTAVVSPATGTSDSTLSVNTTGTCPAGDRTQTRIFGAGFPAAGSNVSAKQRFDQVQTGSGYSIPLQQTMRTFASEQTPAATLTGRYDFMVGCYQGLNSALLGQAVASVYFSSSTVYDSNITPTITTLNASASVVTAGDSLVLTSWVTNDVAGTVEFRDGSTVLGTPVPVSSSTATYTVANVTSGSHLYTAKFVPTSTARSGPSLAEPVWVSTVSAPTAPQSVTAVGGNGQALVSWTAPASTGGGAIEQYTVTSIPGGKTCTTATTSCIVSDLTNGRSYTFEVTATNQATLTSVAGVSGSATPAPTFGTASMNPTDGTASVPGALTTVGFCPAGDAVRARILGSGFPVGGAPVSASVAPGTVSGGSGYSLTLNALDAVAAAQDPAATLSGRYAVIFDCLRNSAVFSSASTSIYFTSDTDFTSTIPVTTSTQLVSDVQSALVGDPVTLTASVTPTTIPGSVKFYDGTTLLETVAAQEGSASSTIQSIASGTHSYTAQFVPSDADNVSGSDSQPVVITPVVAPTVPRSVSALPGNGQVVVRWQAPLSNGGLDITLYTVSIVGGGTACTTISELSCVVTGLDNGTAYSFTVSATNAASLTSAESSASAEVTPVASFGTVRISAPEYTTAGQELTLKSVGRCDAGDTLSVVLQGAGLAADGVTIRDHVAASDSETLVDNQPGYEIVLPGFASAWDLNTPLAPTGLYTYTIQCHQGAASDVLTSASASIYFTSDTAFTTAIPVATSLNVEFNAISQSLVAVISPSVVEGTVVFYDGQTEIGSAIIEAGVTELALPNLAVGAHSFSGMFVPTDSVNVLGTTSATVPVDHVVEPDAPQNVSTIAGNGQLYVAWEAPAQTGGRDITAYEVSAVPVDEQLGSPASCSTEGTLSCVVEGLANDVAYTVTVTATNAATLTSMASDPSEGTPVETFATATTIAPETGDLDSEISVSIDSTCPVQGSLQMVLTGEGIQDPGLVVAYVQDFSTLAVQGGMSVPFEQTLRTFAVGQQLSFGGLYTVTVECFTPGGQAAFTQSEATLYFTSPEAWTSLLPVASTTTLVADRSAQVAGGSVVLTATVAPSGIGGTVEFFDGENTLDSVEVVDDVASLEVTFPDDGQTHSYTATFTPFDTENIVESTSDPVDVAAIVAPAAPTRVTGVAGDRSVTLSWVAPATTGGEGITITSYAVSANPGGSVQCVTVSATSCRVSNLTNGTAYRFTMTATNSADLESESSAASSPVTPVAPATKPGAPTGVKAALNGTVSGSLKVSWTAPANGGSPITGYTVTSNTGKTWQSAGTGTTFTVTGLTVGTSYTFTVKATNAIGTSGASAASASAVAPGAPGAVTALKGSTPSKGNVTVTWTAPAKTNGSAITKYEYRYKTGSSFSAWKSVTKTTASLTGMKKGVAVTIEVRAVNAFGTGTSASLKYTPTK